MNSKFSCFISAQILRCFNHPQPSRTWRYMHWSSAAMFKSYCHSFRCKITQTWLLFARFINVSAWYTWCGIYWPQKAGGKWKFAGLFIVKMLSHIWIDDWQGSLNNDRMYVTKGQRGQLKMQLWWSSLLFCCTLKSMYFFITKRVHTFRAKYMLAYWDAAHFSWKCNSSETQHFAICDEAGEIQWAFDHWHKTCCEASWGGNF